MPIAATLFAAALAAAPALPAAALPPDPPPLLVSVAADADIESDVVSRVLDEAAAIWRRAGVTLAWRRVPAVSPSSSPMPRRYASALRVTIGHGARQPSADEALPLAWIVFDTDTIPEPDIYVSLDNVLLLMRRSPGVVGAIDDMPRAQRDTLLGRGLGRALAHEIGHYILASKVHTDTGLMQTRRSVAELFSSYADRFQVTATQRREIAERVQRLVLAQREAATES